MMAAIDPSLTYETPDGFERLVAAYDEDTAWDLHQELSRIVPL